MSNSSNEKPKKDEETENAEPVDTRTGYYPEDIANTFGVPLEQYRRETAVTDMDGYVTMAMFTGAEKSEADKAAEQDKTADG